MSEPLHDPYTAPADPASADYDAWFRTEVEAALQEAADPNVELISNEEVEREWRVQRAELLKRIKEPSG